jgi:hypothetical protein
MKITSYEFYPPPPLIHRWIKYLMKAGLHTKYSKVLLLNTIKLVDFSQIHTVI